MATTTEGPSRLPVQVQKPTPYTFDLGLLLAQDPNPLQLSTAAQLEEELAATARDGAQALINQLLSTCPITSTPSGVLLSLPAIESRIPREKPLPTPAAQTTWQKFAAKKGIKPKSAATRQNLQYNPDTGEWEKKWGYKGANKAKDDQWIVEVDEKKEVDGDGGRGAGRRERRERVKRNERLMRRNERRGRKGGGN